MRVSYLDKVIFNLKNSFYPLNKTKKYDRIMQIVLQVQIR